ncbi:MAG: BAX inhibitor (BI)-1/YccA family protein, partial [Alphaproteobacteria bacterium]
MAFGPDTRFTTGWGRPVAADAAAIDAGLRAYMLRVYNWMASGLLVTGIVAYVI